MFISLSVFWRNTLWSNTLRNFWVRLNKGKTPYLNPPSSPQGKQTLSLCLNILPPVEPGPHTTYRLPFFKTTTDWEGGWGKNKIKRYQVSHLNFSHILSFHFDFSYIIFQSLNNIEWQFLPVFLVFLWSGWVLRVLHSAIFLAYMHA